MTIIQKLLEIERMNKKREEEYETLIPVEEELPPPPPDDEKTPSEGQQIWIVQPDVRNPLHEIRYGDNPYTSKYEIYKSDLTQEEAFRIVKRIAEEFGCRYVGIDFRRSDA